MSISQWKTHLRHRQVIVYNPTKYLSLPNLGDCGAPVNGFGVQCNGIGGQPPATIAEFTLDGWGGSDYYDLSNVDGHSIGMTIRPIPGQYTMVNNPSLGKYNCGTVCILKSILVINLILGHMYI